MSIKLTRKQALVILKAEGLPKLPTRERINVIHRGQWDALLRTGAVLKVRAPYKGAMQYGVFGYAANESDLNPYR